VQSNDITTANPGQWFLKKPYSLLMMFKSYTFNSVLHGMKNINNFITV